MRLFGLVLVLGGCTFARTEVSAAKDVLDHVPTRIVVGPNCGPLGDAVGGLLLRYGFDIYDSNQVNAVMARANMTEIEVYQPENLRLLKERGVDAILQIRTVGGWDNRPQSATARLIATENARVLVNVTWNNRAAAGAGSPIDTAARMDLASAADDIAEGIAEALGKGD